MTDHWGTIKSGAEYVRSYVQGWRDYGGHTSPATESLLSFFGDFPLVRIEWQQVQEYQKHAYAAGTTPHVINVASAFLRVILKQANFWNELHEDNFRPLHTNNRPGRIVPAKLKELLLVLDSRPEWRSMYLEAQLILGTALTQDESRHLRVGDVDLLQNLLTVRAYRNVTTKLVPMLEKSALAAEELVQIANKRGAVAPDDYLMPRRAGSRKEPRYQPGRPYSEHVHERDWREATNGIGGQYIAGPTLDNVRASALDLHPELAATATGTDYCDFSAIFAQHSAAASPAPGPDPLQVLHEAPPEPRVPEDEAPAPAVQPEIPPAAQNGHHAPLVSIPALIQQLKAAGIPAEQILEIVSKSTR